MKTYFYGANAYYDALALAKAYAEEHNMEIKEFPLTNVRYKKQDSNNQH